MTPEEALRLAKTVTDIYGAASVDLLRAIARALAAGVDRPDWAEQALARVLRLRREGYRVVAQMQAAAPSEVQQLLTQVYAEQAGPVGTTAVQAYVTALAADTVRVLDGTIPPVLRWTEDTYRQVIADTTGAAVAGAATRRDAAAAALDRFATAGVGGFTDGSGRTWRLESYTEMATRTALGRAHVAGTLANYATRGVDAVVVSDSPEECPLCRPYEGKVLSISGAGAPVDLQGLDYAGSLDAAQAAGLLHPNCTHRLTAFVPGLTRPMSDTENPGGYDDRQRQRELERRVRDSRRRVAAAEPLGDTPTLTRNRALLARRRQDLTDFVEQADRKGHVSARRATVRVI